MQVIYLWWNTNDYNNSNNGENAIEQASYKKLFKLLIDKDLKNTEFAAKVGIN